ncbi:PREDICTED: carboxyl-terminal-processing peptidase 3, chloroplastic-like [Erythranthe guttata]|uniref:carboxyl-terminal-processing peptidase 3, chloroplastic-like n=1 Tax=Erythranthe guttata TaxID=4155 RepID=UPI00064DE3A2|nr:PREDICTED: carboxyl-terminal-processing peptidase 3, chloroplastic-like [Erythranthe guttata]|eukprot:XP_012846777.1 PREDICTED: carboxyl-terminal-processing peptidase 3, chloroplastic-like [Erythranthe guttata]
MVEMFPLRSEGAAYNKIKGMLSTVGDPFTRIISPKEYRSFRIESDGNLQGVGLFINVEPQTGHMVFLLCIENSPAERAGIREGDELMEINGARLAGVASEAAAQKLRGHVGTTVTVKVHTVDDFGSSYIREVNIPREVIKLSPISSAIIPHKLPDGHLSKTGYVKLATFSQTAALEMENTVHEMESQGVQSYILDLRNNPGGLVKAGFDVAQIWLDGTETLVNTIDTDGNMLPIDMIDGHALTRDPLVVLRDIVYTGHTLKTSSLAMSRMLMKNKKVLDDDTPAWFSLFFYSARGRTMPFGQQLLTSAAASFDARRRRFVRGPPSPLHSMPAVLAANVTSHRIFPPMAGVSTFDHTRN